MVVDSAATRVVLVTAPDAEVGRSIACALVEERLAACVNLIPGVLSVYRWEGALTQDEELLLVIKTSAARLPDLERRLAALHPYDVPECVTLAPERVEARYAAWLLAAVDEA